MSAKKIVTSVRDRINKTLAAMVGKTKSKAYVDESVGYGRARGDVVTFRPRRDADGNALPFVYFANGQIDPAHAITVESETVWNVITNAGRDFLHLQGYGAAGLGTNGLEYIALSNDALTENAASTVLSTEIAANGLARAIGVVSHTNGTNTTTIVKTFTATGAQAAQKAALFTAAAAGTMNHVLAFTQRSLQTGDTLQITFTITLG